MLNLANVWILPDCVQHPVEHFFPLLFCWNSKGGILFQKRKGGNTEERLMSLS